MQLEQDFVFRPLPEMHKTSALASLEAMPDPLGPLHSLLGKWKGHGFNQIWRPFHGSQDRFLELNLTDETLEFERIPGEIPNRGLLQDDIVLFGLTYLQQVQDRNLQAGIHVEPGIWATVPATTNPTEQATVVRMASIPHGTTINAQGISLTVASGPIIKPASITPFVIGQPANLVQFPESNLATPSTFRSPPVQIAGITQAMVDNPNSILLTDIAGQTITQTVVLQINSQVGILAQPTVGGGTDNIAFLDGAAAGPNAKAAEVDAIFWIELVKDKNGKMYQQLQYTQRVLLNFNGLSWPHVSVATLHKV